MNLIAGDGGGGSDRLALDLSKTLKQMGHRVIWGSPSSCYLTEEAKEKGIETYNPYPSGIIDMSGVSGLVRFCGDENIDIVNAHHSHSRHMLLRARVQGLRSKIVFTRHCILKTLPYFGTFIQNLAVDMNIAVSNSVKESLIKSGLWQKKISMVYGGIDIEKFENVGKDKIERVKEAYKRNGAFNIGIVARVGLHKGRTDKPTMKRHEVLFSALAGFRENFNLLVLGTSEERDMENLKVIAKDNGLDAGRIIFCGFQKDMAPFYKILDLNVLPSLHEGLGLAVIEAMAAGVPCIGADSGGLREIITDGKDGFLFRPGDSAELGRKIKLMFNNKGMRDSFALNARGKAKELFDIKKNAVKIENIFYNLLGQPAEKVFCKGKGQ